MWVISGAKIATAIRKTMKIPPARATLSLRSRRQAICPRDRPWISLPPPATRASAKSSVGFGASRVLRSIASPGPRSGAGTTAVVWRSDQRSIQRPSLVKQPCAPLPNRDRTQRGNREHSGARLEDHDGDLAIGPRLVGVVVAVEIDQSRPQLGTLGALGGMRTHRSPVALDLHRDVRVGFQVAEPQRVLGTAGLRGDHDDAVAVAQGDERGGGQLGGTTPTVLDQADRDR